MNLSRLLRLGWAMVLRRSLAYAELSVSVSVSCPILSLLFLAHRTSKRTSRPSYICYPPKAPKPNFNLKHIVCYQVEKKEKREGERKREFIYPTTGYSKSILCIVSDLAPDGSLCHKGVILSYFLLMCVSVFSFRDHINPVLQKHAN
jgi:hypothetical protein